MDTKGGGVAGLWGVALFGGNLFSRTPQYNPFLLFLFLYVFVSIVLKIVPFDPVDQYKSKPTSTTKKVVRNSQYSGTFLG